MKNSDFFINIITHKLKTNSQNGISKVCYKIGVVSTAVGIAFTICAMLIMNGFHSNIEHRLTNLVGDMSILDINSKAETDPIDAILVKSLLNNLTEEVAETKSYAYKVALLQKENDFEGITLYGLDNTENHENINQFIYQGALPKINFADCENEIAISRICAEKLNVSVGCTLILCILKDHPSYRRVTICGIYDSKFPDFDEKFAFCDIRFIQKLNNWTNENATGVSIFLKRNKDRFHLTKDLNKKLQQLALRKGKFPQSMSIQAIPIEDLYYDIFSWISILYKNTFIFILLLLIIVNTNLSAIISIQIINTLYMIGVLKSLGASIKQLIKIFTKYNLEMIIKGVLYGNIAGLSICLLQSYTKFIKLNPETYYIDHVPVDWSLYPIGLINFTVLVTSFLVLVSTQVIIFRTKSLVERKV